MEGDDGLLYLLHGEDLSQQGKALVLKGPHGIVQNDYCKFFCQQGVILQAEVFTVRACVMISPERIDIVSRQSFCQLLNHPIMMPSPCGHQIPYDQRDIISAALLQGTCVYFHMISSQPFASGVSDYSDRVHVFKAHNGL